MGFLFVLSKLSLINRKMIVYLSFLKRHYDWQFFFLIYKIFGILLKKMAATARQEQELKQNSLNAIKTSTDSIELLRARCLARGTNGIREFAW